MTAEQIARVWQEALALGLPEGGWLGIVDCSSQSLLLVRAGRVERRYVVSTSAVGLGHRDGSHRTPWGFHAVAERFGADQPLGAVFRARQPTGRVLAREEWQGSGGEDLITSRILRLRGLEPGVNSGEGIDSYARCIYLHGTNHEDRLGRAASGGCVRLGNEAVADLFDRTADAAFWCWIGEPA